MTQILPKNVTALKRKYRFQKNVLKNKKKLKVRSLKLMEIIMKLVLIWKIVKNAIRWLKVTNFNVKLVFRFSIISVFYKMVQFLLSKSKLVLSLLIIHGNVASVNHVLNVIKPQMKISLLCARCATRLSISTV